MLRGPSFTRPLLGKPFTFVFAGHRFGRCDSVSADIERENALSWTIESVRTHLRELSAQFAVLWSGVLKGAAGGHDDVCFAFGRILLAADGRGLTGLWFEGQEHFGSTLLKEDAEYVEGADAVSGAGGMSSVSPANGVASSVLERSWAWLNAYFAGQEPRFTPPLHMIGTAFQREVWFELLSIPRGEVATYGEIARRVAARHRVPGNEAPVVSPRAVGAAVARNPISIIVPCHRVVAADGSLNGYAGGLDRKEWLLRLEGAYEE